VLLDDDGASDVTSSVNLLEKLPIYERNRIVKGWGMTMIIMDVPLMPGRGMFSVSLAFRTDSHEGHQFGMFSVCLAFKTDTHPSQLDITVPGLSTTPQIHKTHEMSLHCLAANTTTSS